MAGVTMAVTGEFKERAEQFVWVNWSGFSRVEARKKDIFEKYLKTGKVSDEDWEFCEKIDWHPVDELPLKEEAVKELEERKKGPFIRLNSVDEIFEE